MKQRAGPGPPEDRPTPALVPGPGEGEPGPFRDCPTCGQLAPTHPALPRPKLYNWAEDPGYLLADSPLYELPAWPDCISCDGRGWYAEIDTSVGDLIDVRCPCYETQLILKGPPE